MIVKFLAGAFSRIFFGDVILMVGILACPLTHFNCGKVRVVFGIILFWDNQVIAVSFKKMVRNMPQNLELTGGY